MCRVTQWCASIAHSASLLALLPVEASRNACGSTHARIDRTGKRLRRMATTVHPLAEARLRNRTSMVDDLKELDRTPAVRSAHTCGMRPAQTNTPTPPNARNGPYGKASPRRRIRIASRAPATRPALITVSALATTMLGSPTESPRPTRNVDALHRSLCGSQGATAGRQLASLAHTKWWVAPVSQLANTETHS